VTWRNPFGYFDSVRLGPDCHKDDVDLTHLEADLSKPAKTPSLAYIAPSPCDDGSAEPASPARRPACPRPTAFLKKVVPEIKRSAAYKDGGLIAITFDEAPQTGVGADRAPAVGPRRIRTCRCRRRPLPARQRRPGRRPHRRQPPPRRRRPRQPPTPAPTTGEGPTTPTGGGGQVGLLLISSFVKAGSSDLVDYYNHFSLLASIEDLFGLKHLGYASDPALSRFDGATYNAGKPG